MPKTVTLEQTGWKVEGLALINLWGGGQGEIPIKPSTIPLGKLTKESLHRAINDGGFGCESIQSATLYVGEIYQGGYVQNWRRVYIDNPRHDLVKRGV